jgi:hypothetical protein
MFGWLFSAVKERSTGLAPNDRICRNPDGRVTPPNDRDVR